MPFILIYTSILCTPLAGDAAGLVGARVVSAGDGHVGPGPVSAAAVAAVNVDGIVGVRLNSAGDATKRKTTDSNAVGGLVAVVRLVDVDAVVGDAGESNVLVRHVLDCTGVSRLGLDADSVLRADDGRRLKRHARDRVVVPAADGADAQAVAARAVATSKDNVL
jgi:hypothetical protein